LKIKVIFNNDLIFGAIFACELISIAFTMQIE